MPNYIWSLILLPIVLIACANDQSTFSPKPRMYPRVELPVPEYISVDEAFDCGFTFRMSKYAQLHERTSYFGEELENECWFDIRYPDLDASIHFTYYPIDAQESFQNLANESFRMAYEHSSIASGIHEQPLSLNGKESGMIFTLTGPVASPYQFYLTDTTHHFLRASLYFNARPNPDSIAPMLEYIKVDLDTLIKSFQWK
ncbi:MAG TPA: hypothetical protein VKZ56_08105 [Membranihabitans sp.]|nr:hypothetical protein [Membranihabitans sp.]